MSKLFLDNENNIIEQFQLEQYPPVKINFSFGEIIFLYNTQLERKTYEKIANKEKWKQWKDSSGKGDPPPDFYSDTYKMMMDVMRVNDNEQKFINGKKEVFVNKEVKAERKTLNYIEKMCGGKIPAETVIINTSSGLEGEQAHNYQKYKEHFQRIVSKHMEKIPLYKQNHPGYKTIFFICDESDCYRIEPGMTSNDFHLFYKDKNFVEIFIKSGIDIVIWHTPEKRVLTPEFGWIQCFNTVIIDTRCLKEEDLIEYDENKIKYCNK